MLSWEPALLSSFLVSTWLCILYRSVPLNKVLFPVFYSFVSDAICTRVFNNYAKLCRNYVATLSDPNQLHGAGFWFSICDSPILLMKNSCRSRKRLNMSKIVLIKWELPLLYIHNGNRLHKILLIHWLSQIRSKINQISMVRPSNSDKYVLGALRSPPSLFWSS